jgi:hypothetical protein
MYLPVRWPQAPTQAKPDSQGSTSLQRKPDVAAPAVCCPDNTTAAAPGIYRPDIAAQGGFSTPHVYRPQPAVQQKRIVGATVASDPPSNAHIRGADPATDPHSANLGRNATSRGPSGPPVVQRMLWNAGKGCWMSTFDLTTVIDVNTATITVAATEDTFTGGHAEIYLEYPDPNPKEVMLDMIGGNDNRAILRRYNKQPGEISNRGAWWVRGQNATREYHKGGGSRTYSITMGQVQAALDAFDQMKGKADNGEIKYTYWFPGAWSAVSSEQYINCADFAEYILAAAGVPGVTSSIFSRPKYVAIESHF